jgi:hypothetical protein
MKINPIVQNQAISLTYQTIAITYASSTAALIDGGFNGL